MGRNYQRNFGVRISKIKRKFNVRNISNVRDIGNVALDSVIYPLYAVIVKSPNKDAKKVFVSAGVHGDEPAGVYALLGFLEDKIERYLDDYSFVVLPCLNPTGFVRGSRFNADCIDINRDFKEIAESKEASYIKRLLRRQQSNYAFAMDLHEDRTDKRTEDIPIHKNPRGFYLYEVSYDRKTRRGHKIIDSMKNDGIRVYTDKKVYYCSNENGLLWKPKLIHHKEGTIEEYVQRYAFNAFTTETPTCWPMKERIHAQITALCAALEEFKNVQYASGRYATAKARYATR
ncbi:M14 family metallocarboxypeptidase [Candidatus Woesearchaeota archaeon]|nr:M14 family metallocarboxypeptidase [Candidatus Woesearchaeota archaeon]